jgi:hypothetical protein
MQQLVVDEPRFRPETANSSSSKLEPIPVRRGNAGFDVCVQIRVGKTKGHRAGLPPFHAQRPLRPRAWNLGEAGSAQAAAAEHWTVRGSPARFLSGRRRILPRVRIRRSPQTKSLSAALSKASAGTREGFEPQVPIGGTRVSRAALTEGSHRAVPRLNCTKPRRDARELEVSRSAAGVAGERRRRIPPSPQRSPPRCETTFCDLPLGSASSVVEANPASTHFDERGRASTTTGCPFGAHLATAITVPLEWFVQ